MKTRTKPGYKTLHPTVGTRMVLDNGRESINTGFTDQKLSPHAGSATFWSFLRPSGFIEKLKARKGGYSLDFDSTRRLHEDGHQEGVVAGYTRMGVKPCLHPLLAVLEEAKLVAGFWLRPGNTACATSIIAFTLEVLARLG